MKRSGVRKRNGLTEEEERSAKDDKVEEDSADDDNDEDASDEEEDDDVEEGDDDDEDNEEDKDGDNSDIEEGDDDEEEEEDDDDEDGDDNNDIEEGDNDASHKNDHDGSKGDEDDEEDDAPSSKRPKLVLTGSADLRKKGTVPGIVYLGHIPPRLRPRHMRNMLTPYGEIGRIYLQPEDKGVKRAKQKAGSRGSNFTEGWVEFRDKRLAKRVAASLHNTPMGNRKRNRFHSDLWNMKYLHRFQWTHLSERLAYEQTVLQQRLRTEISQAKKETNFYLANVEKSTNLDKQRKKKEKKGEKVEERQWDFTQRQTEEEIQLRKMKKQTNSISQKHTQRAQDKARLIQQKSQSNVSLLAKIFNANKSQD